MLDLWTPLGGDILEGGGAHHGEADQEHVRLGVGQRPQSEHNTHFSTVSTGTRILHVKLGLPTHVFFDQSGSDFSFLCLKSFETYQKSGIFKNSNLFNYSVVCTLHQTRNTVGKCTMLFYIKFS